MARTDASTADIGKLAVTAGSLLLNAPDAGVQANLQRAGYTVAGERSVQQLFFDRLGIPQSGLYLPAYEHVFRKRELVDRIWHFPPARHDGALEVEGIYQSLGFHCADVPASSLFRGANIPGDHLGFMLVFVGSALQGMATDREVNTAFVTVITGFIEAHLDGWVDAFCTSLPVGNAGGYLEALADAVQEAIGLLRAWAARDVAAKTQTAPC